MQPTDLLHRVRTAFGAHFASPLSATIVLSPGRINLIGEHTDYNDGFVLPAAINRYICLVIKANEVRRIRLFAADLGEWYEGEAGVFVPQTECKWANYLLGVAAELAQKGFALGGFDAVFGSNLPVGAGLSSSAALANSAGVGLRRVFELRLSDIELALCSQRAEHRFAGVSCGIMDSFASLMGRAGEVLLLDCRTLDYQYLPLDLEENTLVLCNSNVRHDLAASAYNTRRSECQQGVAALQRYFPHVTHLRDVSLGDLQRYAADVSPVVYRRCRYVIEEDARVRYACNALLNRNWRVLGNLLYRSHAGLQTEYEVSCEALDVLVAATKPLPYVWGARMMGGGFGGCTLNLVEKAAVADFQEVVQTAYAEASGGKVCDFYEVTTADGARVLEQL